MWHSVLEYLLSSMVIALLLHSISNKYAMVTFAGAVVCPVLDLIHLTIVAGGQVNIGWIPPIFVAGFVVALPVCALVGLPFLGLRLLCQRSHPPTTSQIE